MDNYIKDKQIGEGSFGKAFLVKNKITNTLYVMKEINISRMSQKERKEARKEVEVLSQMNHPNIVSYQESFEEHGFLFIIMDYCDGGDLYSRINNQRGIPFSEEQILDWFVQLCLSLKHVHDRKILHRDIKSQNIFLTKDYIIKLGDFGIARVLNSTMDLARTCIGTPYYLSPEICENKPYNNKSDIWSLGCVLYELVTLKHAFEAGNMKNLVLKIIRGSYPPVPCRYSYDLRNLITQLFKRNPKDRPSINNILKKPFIKKYAVKFISESQLTNLDTPVYKNRNQIPKAVGEPKKVERISKPAAKYGISVANRRQSVLEEKKRKAAYISEKANELAMLKKNLLERQRKEKQDRILKVERNCLIQKDDAVFQNADVSFNERGNYDFYHAMLDKIHLEQDIKKEKLRLVNDPIYISNENRAYLQQPGKDCRAMLVEEFLKRKHEAEVNKAKVAYDMGVQIIPKIPPLFAYVNKNTGISENSKISSEDEYLARLKAIRMQNMYEQRVLKDKMAAEFKGIKLDIGPEGDCITYNPTEIQNNRVDLLKHRIAKIKAKMEEKRQEAYEKEKLQWKEHLEAKVQKSVIESNASYIPVQGESGDIFIKNIEENNEVQQNVKETEYKHELNIDNLKHERSRWQAINHMVLNEFPLEQTRSEMEETSVNDIVITNPSKSIVTGDRHHWDVPINPVVDELQNFQVGSSTVILTSESSIQSPAITEVDPSSDSNVGTSNDQGNFALIDKSLENCVPLDEQKFVEINVAIDKVINISKNVSPIAADLNDSPGYLQESSKYEVNSSIVVNRLKKNSEDDNNYLLTMLRSGTYDTNARNLRTCSMPDLSKLGINPHEEEHLIVPKEVITKEKTNSEIIKSDDKIDYSPDFDDDDDEDDMTTLRRSMASLLVEENDKKETADEEEENNAISDDALSETSGSISPNEDWHSDNSSEEDTMCSNGKFIQLELCRLQLEEELGLNKFLEAYRAVQAIHEDEDDSMVDGICIMNNILGENKEFLYSKILQLVMADGAFTEDNE